jgi:hypothetical protein
VSTADVGFVSSSLRRGGTAIRSSRRRILVKEFQMQPAHSNPALPEVCKPAPSAVKWEWQPDAEFLWFLPHRRNSPGCFSLAAAAIFSADRPLDEPSLPLPATRNDQSRVGCRRRIDSVGTIGLSPTSVSPASGNWPRHPSCDVGDAAPRVDMADSTEPGDLPPCAARSGLFLTRPAICGLI